MMPPAASISDGASLLTTLAKAGIVSYDRNCSFIVLATVITIANYDGHLFIVQATGPNVTKLFTAVIYCHSMVILSFCVIKQHYLGNYCGMSSNYNGIYLTNVIKHNLT